MNVSGWQFESEVEVFIELETLVASCLQVVWFVWYRCLATENVIVCQSLGCL